MANPLSDRGWSDRDYAAAVGTLMGEAAARGNLRDFQAIADVITNRLDAGVYGKSVAGITMNPREFSTWSPKEKGAFAQARAGFAAALNPTRAASLSPSLRGRVEMAQKALEDVNVTGVARGIAQGATAYHNPAVTAKLGTDGWHNMLEDKYGAVQIGAHTFTGPGFRPGQSFDPITYNGQLAAPMAADPFLGDVGVPVNRIDVSSIPDITPASAGFSLEGATLPSDFSMDFGAYDIAPDYSGITANTAFDQRTSFSPSAPAAPNFSDVDVGSYPDISESLYNGPPQTTNETFGPAVSEMGFGGFSAGFNEGPYGATPDFSAPSLEARNAFDRQEGIAQSAALGMGYHSSDLNPDAIARSVMDELGPQTPAMAPAPVASAAPSFTAPSAPIGDFDEFGPSFPSATPQAPAPQAAPQPRAAAPSVSLPSAPAPAPSRTQAQVAKDFDLPSFDLPDMGLPSLPSPTVRGVGSALGMMDPIEKTGFMDAMANPQIAQGWSPGFLDTRLGKGIASAGVGFATGGPFGAITNGLYSGLGIGDMFSNAFDRYANAYANLAPQDFAMFGIDGDWTTREPTRNTGYEGGSRVGDGSYSDHAGYNDNSPQGIL